MSKTTERPLDLSDTAVTRRLEEVRALYKLMLALREIRIDEARPVEPRTP